MEHPSDPQDPQALLVFCTCPDQACAEQLAETLVNERLAACASLMPGLISHYRWQGQIQRDQEWLLLIKTQVASYPALETQIRALHPYQVPEIIALPVQTGLPAYLAWIADNTDNNTDGPTP